MMNFTHPQNLSLLAFLVAFVALVGGIAAVAWDEWKKQREYEQIMRRLDEGARR